MAKYWEAGQVKTRLGRDVGLESAAQLQRAFLQTLLERLSPIDGRRVLVFTPNEREPEFAELARGEWGLEPQSQGRLGIRMRSYFDNAFRAGCRRVALVGADSPSLPIERITAAFDQLESVPVVIGPSRDGGYYLVAARDRTPPIFADLDWGTSTVLAETRSLLDASGVEHALLDPWCDVDTIDDLHQLEDELANATEPALQSLGRRIAQITRNRT